MAHESNSWISGTDDQSNFLRGRTLNLCVLSTGSKIDDLQGPSIHLFSITASSSLWVVVGLGALTCPQLQEFKRRRRRTGKRRRKKFNHVFETEFKKKKKMLLTKEVKESCSGAKLGAVKVRAGWNMTAKALYVTVAHSTRTTALRVPALWRFTHSSSALNESANHPMHWTSQTILYLSSGCGRENNDSLTQVKEVTRLNQYFYYPSPPFPTSPPTSTTGTFRPSGQLVLLDVIEYF